MSTKFYVADPSGAFVPAKDSDLLAEARLAAKRRLRPGVAFDSPRATRKWLVPMLGSLEHEIFGVAHLTTQHKLIAFEELFRGTIDGASVHPREVVKSVLAHNAAAVVLVHNHPSGVCEPSIVDESITRRLKDALGLIDVRVLDHFLVAGDDVVSFAERGLI